MTGKKKNMDGGRLFGLLQNKPIITQAHNTYLNTIRILHKNYENINPRTITVNNLNTKVKSFNKFAKTNKNNGFQPLLEQLKLQLIEKIKLSLHEFIRNKFIFDYNIPFAKLLDQLLDQLKEFEKLLNLLKLLDKQYDFSIYNYQIQDFINKILGQYEDYYEKIFRTNPNINILQQLYQQVQDYITKYSEFIESMTNNRKRNNPIYTIIERLNNISDRISIKISILSSSINESNISNSMKRRINQLYDANKNQKEINYNRILKTLHEKYKNTSYKYNLKELTELAKIESKIKSINRISNENNKYIMLKDLRKTIKSLNNSLNKYDEFKEYKRLIIPSE